jgi:hypothetical protein
MMKRPKTDETLPLFGRFARGKKKLPVMIHLMSLSGSSPYKINKKQDVTTAFKNNKI